MPVYLAVIELLPLISEDGAYHSASVLDHHLPRIDFFDAVEAKPMDVRLEHTNVLLVHLLMVAVSHRHGQV